MPPPSPPPRKALFLTFLWGGCILNTTRPCKGRYINWQRYKHLSNTQHYYESARSIIPPPIEKILIMFTFPRRIFYLRTAVIHQFGFFQRRETNTRPADQRAETKIWDKTYTTNTRVKFGIKNEKIRNIINFYWFLQLRKTSFKFWIGLSLVGQWKKGIVSLIECQVFSSFGIFVGHIFVNQSVSFLAFFQFFFLSCHCVVNPAE